MKSWKKANVLGLACMLALGGLTACGDDDGGTPDGSVDSSVDGTVDSSTPDGALPDSSVADAGDGSVADAGDAGGDAGDGGVVETNAFVRVAHLMANAPPGSTAATGGYGAVRVCVTVDLTGATIGPLPSRMGGDVGLPHRGVSQYLDFPVGLDYTVDFYAADEIDALAGAEHCPTDADTITALVSTGVATADIEAGSFYTAAAIGLLADDAGDLPSICGATFDGACPAVLAASISLGLDDSDIVADMVKIRWAQGIANFPMADLCYDDDPEDATAATTLFSNIAPLSTSDYITVAPMAAGVLTVHQHIDGMECVGAALLATIPVPIPEPLASMLPPNTLVDYPADHVATIFSSGRVSLTLDPATDPMTPLFLTWIDQPIAM